MANFTPAAPAPINIKVNGISLIPQDSSNACWYASTMMMYNWNRSTGGTPVNPSTIASIQQTHQANNGLPWATMVQYATTVGMTPKPLMTPTIEQLAAWLRDGPLWTDGIPVNWQGQVSGTGHVVVLAGLRSVPSSDLYEVYVYDPWPPNVGHEGWRPISHLVSIMRAGSNPARSVTFLSY